MILTFNSVKNRNLSTIVESFIFIYMENLYIITFVDNMSI